MIDDIAPKPPDPLLKIIKAFREDPRDDKIDLGVGVYRDENGATPVMAAIKQAERRLVEEQKTKTYVGQQGDVEFLRLLGELAFDAQAGELVAIQAVGGTGALRLGFDLMRAAGARSVVVPTPSWPNHPAIVAAAGLRRIDAPFFDVAEQRIDIARVLDEIAKLAPGEPVLLQGCCHNPLGADFSPAEWDALAEAIVNANAAAFIDVAYQGFGDGIERDMDGVRRLLARVPRAVIAVSGAKTFGLYRERVGALYVKAPAAARNAVASNLYAIARANYSMPPDHGAACVRLVLGDADLRTAWKVELDGIRAHILKTRAKLAAARVGAMPMHPIGAQKGMFSTLPLSAQQIERLRLEHGVYMTDDGRINVAGLPAQETARFIEALQAVA